MSGTLPPLTWKKVKGSHVGDIRHLMRGTVPVGVAIIPLPLPLGGGYAIHGLSGGTRHASTLRDAKTTGEWNAPS
jgi:hypothetical protein